MCGQAEFYSVSESLNVLLDTITTYDSGSTIHNLLLTGNIDNRHYSVLKYNFGKSVIEVRKC